MTCISMLWCITAECSWSGRTWISVVVTTATEL